MAAVNKNPPLVELLGKIWSKNIRGSYIEGKLCSERQLQAELYMHLSKDYTVWVETKLYMPKSKLDKKIPDLIITDGEYVVGIIELKYKLNQGVDMGNDLGKLKSFSKLGTSLQLKMNPDTGEPAENHEFKMRNDVQLIFAAIAWKGSEAVDDFRKWKKKSQKDCPNNLYHFYGRIDEGKYIFDLQIIPAKSKTYK